jgi:amino acid transporter
MDLEAQRARDAAELSRLGYAQQLLRDMGGFGNFALSFSIISVLTGAVTLYGLGLKSGGPLVMSAGWPLVALLTLPIAASLAQLASAYPTAGALYHWSALLGGRGWGFLTAWLNTIGQFAITAGIDYGLAEFISALLQLPPGRGPVLAICTALLVSHAALNHVGVRVVARLNHLSAWYHVAVGGALVAALLALAPKQDAAFLLTRFTADPKVLDGHALLAALFGGPLAYGFCIGLIQAGWTFTGYDASAHVTEETVDPTRNAPWGIFLSVAVSGLFGWMLVVAVTLAVKDLPQAAAADNPFLHILTTALGGRLGSALVWLVLGAMWFCGLASVTSNSRMLFAFARDGGLPFSKSLARVSERHRTPHVAVWVSVSAALAVALWADAYSLMTALSTIALYASYGLPIAVGLWARATGRWTRRGPWDLGAHSLWVNLISLVWIAAAGVLFVLPPNQPAGYMFAGCLLLLALYWLFYARSRFRGPKVDVDLRGCP